MLGLEAPFEAAPNHRPCARGSSKAAHGGNRCARARVTLTQRQRGCRPRVGPGCDHPHPSNVTLTCTIGGVPRRNTLGDGLGGALVHVAPWTGPRLRLSPLATSPAASGRRDDDAREPRHSASSAAAGTTRFTSPQARAVCASKNSPVRSISMVRFLPMLRATPTAGVEQKMPTSRCIARRRLPSHSSSGGHGVPALLQPCGAGGPHAARR